MLKIEISQKSGKARTGRLLTAHGEVDTPTFMPVGTAGTVKGLTPRQIMETGSQMILGNTYHLMLRPTAQKVAALGGLHRMMGWNGPILTDSGGYQVFSLAHLRRLTADAVYFQSHIDGSQVELSPEMAVDIQQLLGSDVMMQLDECTPADAAKQDVAAAVERSAVWAGRCKKRW
ncbi:MAG TPA: tRNA guanosine(34) transglycosylase Tgt, partial [Phycisphaerae bacterium]|nr:tRNA guanosine(34) transglycosylase Tgt [Phycisphaerae bacterium]